MIFVLYKNNAPFTAISTLFVASNFLIIELICAFTVDWLKKSSLAMVLFVFPLITSFKIEISLFVKISSITSTLS